MFIKIPESRKFVSFLTNINIIKNDTDFLISFEYDNEIKYPLNQIEIKYEDIQKLSCDFGMVCLSVNYSFEKYILESVTPNTFVSKKPIDLYYSEKQFVPFIVFYTPYKNCPFEKCNVLISHMENCTTNIEFDDTLDSMTNFSWHYNEYYATHSMWGEENCPRFASIDGEVWHRKDLIPLKIGEKHLFKVIIPNNTPLYLQSTIGVLNKFKITQSTEVELDLTSITSTNVDLDEWIWIKATTKFWSDVVEQPFKLIE